MIVHCDLLISLFTTYRLYRLSLNSISRRVPTNNLYYNQALWTHLHNALFRARYRTFPPFSFIIHFIYSGFISHIIFTCSPSNFMCKNLSSRAFRYAHLTLHTPTTLFLRVSIIIESITKSIYIVGGHRIIPILLFPLFSSISTGSSLYRHVLLLLYH